MASSSGNPSEGLPVSAPAGRARSGRWLGAEWWAAGLRPWTLTVAFLAALLFGSTFVEIPARSALQGYDNTFNYLWLRSAMVDGDWDFQNDLAACNTLVETQRTSALALPRTPAGRIPNKYGIGWALLAAPSYGVADGLTVLAQWLGVRLGPRDGFGPIYQVCLQMGNAGWMVLALLLAARVVRSWVGVSVEMAAGAVLAVWTASALFYYGTVNLSMSHSAAFFAVTLMALGAVRLQAAPEVGWGWWVVVGAGWGLAVITRYQLALFGLPVAGLLVQAARRGPGRRFALGVAGMLLGALPLLALQAWAWKSVYGTWWVFSYGAEGEGFRWLQPELAGVLFSPWHGWFYWHPFLLLPAAGFLGQTWANRRDPLPWLWLAALLGTLYVNAAWWCWWFASAFGGRAFDAALLPLMAGLAWAVQRASARTRRWIWCLAVLAACWNVYAAVLYRTGAISRAEPVTWAEMIRAGERLPEALRF